MTANVRAVGALRIINKKQIQMEAIDFLKNKGITKATCYTDGGTYYVSELAKLMEEYAALRQPPVISSVCDHNFKELQGSIFQCTKCFNVEDRL